MAVVQFFKINPLHYGIVDGVKSPEEKVHSKYQPLVKKPTVVNMQCARHDKYMQSNEEGKTDLHIDACFFRCPVL